MAKKKPADFEQALARLEEIVRAMESGEISLDDSLKLYREGVELSLICGKSLGEVEKEVSVLRKTSEGLFLTEPLSL